MRALLVLLIGCAPGEPPRGRVVSIEAPHTALEARAAGCWLDDDLSPTLGRIAAEAGGFDAYLGSLGAPIRWVIVFEAPGIYGSDRQLFSLHLRQGEHMRRDEFRVAPEQGEVQGFRDVWLEEGGWITGEADQLVLPSLELDDGTTFPIALEQVTFNARLLQDDRGLTIRAGALAGRLSGESACLLIDVEPAIIEGPEAVLD